MIETDKYYIINSQEDVWELAEHLRQRAKREINPDQVDSVFDAFQKDYGYYAHRQLWIQPKDGDICRFKFNKGQWYLYAIAEWQLKTTGKVRIIIVKGRQQGISTWTEGRGYWKASQTPGCKAVVLAHESSASDNCFQMFKTYHDSVALDLKPTVGKDNEKQFTFPRIKSSVKVFTSGKKGVGRGQTSNFFHGCLSADSLIVLSSGKTLPMSEIKPGDLVVTSSGAIAPVKHKVFTGEKQTYTLHTWVSGEPIHLTADHKVLTDDGYKRLEQLTTRDFVAMPRIATDSSCITYTHEIRNKNRSQGGGSKHLEEHTFNLNKDFGYFLGYYLAEGHVKDGLGYIVFTYEKNERYIDQAVKSVVGLFTSRRDTIDGNRGRTVLNGKFLASAVNEMVGRVKDKRIPEWMFNAPEEFLDGMFRGYCDGDGSKTQKDKITAPSIHEKISRQLQRVAFMLYGAAAVKGFERYRYEKRTKKSYVLRLSGNPMRKFSGVEPKSRVEKSKVIDGVVYCRVKSIDPRKVEKVWDIEVDHEDHNYQTTAGVVSNSEVAFWEHAYDHSMGIMQSISKGQGSEVYLESTAFGNTGLFADFWNLADFPWEEAKPHGNGYARCFIPWYWEPTYREALPDNFQVTPEEMEIADLFDLDKEQLQWRRKKIAETGGDVARFMRDYPATPEEAFNSSLDNVLIQPLDVIRARKNYKDELSSYLSSAFPAVIGCDVAREGDDATCIVVRQGRVLLHLEQHYKKPGNYIAQRIVYLSQRFHVARAFIDNTGGFGGSVLDFLAVYGYEGALGIHFSESAEDKEQFKNIRSEMWWKLSEWVKDGAALPDSSEMQKDLCTPTYKYQGDKFLLESKYDMKKRSGKSPDVGDAMALTFAHRVTTKSTAQSYDPQEG